MMLEVTRNLCQIAILMGALVSTAAVTSSPAAPVTPDSLRLHSILDSVRTEMKIPGVSAAVIGPDGRTWCSAIGAAGVNERATCADVFETGSITKSYTAALVLGFVAEGRLSLDDSLTRWMPDFPHAAGVTIRHLLQHTSGLYNYSENPDYIPALRSEMFRVWKPEESFVFMKEPYFTPGGGFHYSNANYLLLGLVCERLAGKPFHEALRERVLAPRRLENTFFLPSESPPAMAHAYIDINNDGTPEDVTAMVSLTAFITAAWSAGAVAATASDLARWMRAYASGTVVSGTLFEELTRWVDRGDESFYGMGLIKKEYGGHTILGHRGASAGFSASAWYAPSANITVVVLTNGHLRDVDPIAFALLDSVSSDR